MWELCSVISNDSALTLSFGIIVYHPLVRLSHPVVWSGSCLGIRRTGQLEGTLFESAHLNQGTSTGRPVFRTHRGIGVVTPALAQPISWRQWEHLFRCPECIGRYIGMCRACLFASGRVRAHAIGISRMSRPKPIGTSGTRWRLSPLAWRQFPIA